MSELSKDFVAISTVEDFGDEEMQSFEVGDLDILICRVDEEFHAINGICSHECIELSDGDLEDYYVTCPLHFSRFDIRSGNPIDPPAEKPLDVYELKVVDGKIFVKI